MTPDDGKAPTPRPLARWALATLAMDAALAVALLRLPRPLVVDSVDTRAPVTFAMTVDRHALFLRAPTSAPREGALVIVAPDRATRVVRARAAASEDLPCALIRAANLQLPCDAPRPDPPPPQPRAFVWTNATRERWTQRQTVVNESAGSAVTGDRTVRVTVDGLSVRGRFGYRVEQPWIAIDGARAPLERDLSLERAVLVRDPVNRAPLFIATPEGARVALDPRIEQRRRSALSTLAGRVGELSIAGLIAWMCAQATALAAARTREGSSLFWRRFLRWSAMLATFVTGALALGVLRLAQGH